MTFSLLFHCQITTPMVQFNNESCCSMQPQSYAVFTLSFLQNFHDFSRPGKWNTNFVTFPACGNHVNSPFIFIKNKNLYGLNRSNQQTLKLNLPFFFEMYLQRLTMGCVCMWLWMFVEERYCFGGGQNCKHAFSRRDSVILYLACGCLNMSRRFLVFWWRSKVIWGHQRSTWNNL